MPSTVQPIGEDEFDLAPHPRVLPMLGEITLHQWQCCAELVDNSIDGFLKAARAGLPVGDAEVHISLPSTNSPNVQVQVSDNGPGMDAATLQNAVKAGWTSNDPSGNLGLFGMGFNIATAKLGRRTTVWTSRVNDLEEVGVEIDFDRMTAEGHFRTMRLRRPKIDPARSGTSILVERLKQDQRDWFSVPKNRSQIVKKLGEIYSAMLRTDGSPISVTLYVNGTKVQPWTHCIWGNPADGSPVRSVQVTNGPLVDALQEFDVSLPERPFCQSCWQWLTESDTSCPSCSGGGNVVRRTRRIHGWLGVQRYFSEDEYGIDFIRNGRKIEVKNKDLFLWHDESTDQVVKEYPIDDPRPRGRLVGEVHVDHCRVNYTKSRFERDDSSWDDVVGVLRGRGPLRPNIAQERGFSGNSSPLYRLYQAFRRASPQSRSAGCYARLLLVPPDQNELATRYANEFRKGAPLYRSDERWFDIVRAADQALLTGGAPSPAAAGGTALGGTVPSGFLPAGSGVAGGGGNAGNAPAFATASSQPPLPPPPTRARNAILSHEYRDTKSTQRWDVEAFAVKPNDPDLGDQSRGWALVSDGTTGRYRFLYNPEHDVFRSVTMTPDDALLAELAYRVMDFSRSRQQVSFTFSDVLADLRRQHATRARLEPAELASDARGTLEAVARKVAATLAPENAPQLFAELSEGEKEALYNVLVQSGVTDAEPIIRSGRFVGYLRPSSVVEMFERHPELFLDGKCWDEAFAVISFPEPIASSARAQVKRRFLGLLSDMAWLAEAETASLGEVTRERLLRAALAVEQLAVGD